MMTFFPNVGIAAQLMTASTAYDRLTLAHMAVRYYSLQVVSLQSIVTLKSLAEGLQKYAWAWKVAKETKIKSLSSDPCERA